MSLFRRTALIVLACLVCDLLFVAYRWFAIPHLAQGPIPMSHVVSDYRARPRAGYPLRWHPVPLALIPRTLQRAVILGEDGTFYQNDGFDFDAIESAARYDWRAGRIVYGASTITQQTAKNLFLDRARTFLRKANEALLTVALTRTVTKSRILALYLNNAQFGRGIYGVQAAALYYFGRPVWRLDTRQDAEIAATLPDPTGGNPATRSRYFLNRTRKLLRLLGR